MSEKSYIRVFGKWTVYGWKAEAVFAVATNALVCLGILIGYFLWGSA